MSRSGAADDLIKSLDAVRSSLDDLNKAVSSAGGRSLGGGGSSGAPLGSGKGAGGDEGGGLLGLLGNGLKGAAIGAAATAAAAAVPVIEGGIRSLDTGGTFQDGAAAALNKLAAKVPIIGELTGASRAQNVLEGAQQDLNQTTNEIARFGGDVSRIRGFLAQQSVDQNRRIEDDRRANQTAVEAQLERAREPGQFGRWGRTINDVATNGGAQQHM